MKKLTETGVSLESFEWDVSAGLVIFEALSNIANFFFSNSDE